jgi:hypothetical protein
MRVLVGSLFKPVQLILSEIEELISAQSTGEATIPAAVGERTDEELELKLALIDSMCDKVEVAEIDSVCGATSHNPEIENSALASSVCEQFFGKSCELFPIRGDGNCFCRCLATIVYSLFTNLEVSSVKTRFLHEFSEVIQSFSEGTTIETASDYHQNVRDFINSRLISQFSASEFTDFVNDNCANKRSSDCRCMCQCPLSPERNPQLFDFEKNGFRAELLQGFLSEMNKTDLSHKDIFDCIRINSQPKQYSACTTVAMGLELLKLYCACKLVSIRHDNRAFSIRSDLHQNNDCELAAIIVFEEHTCENLNHYSILVSSARSSSVQICFPMTLALTSLRKAQSILENTEKVSNGVSFEHEDPPSEKNLSDIQKMTKPKPKPKNEFDTLAEVTVLLFQMTYTIHEILSLSITPTLTQTLSNLNHIHEIVSQLDVYMINTYAQPLHFG